MQSHASYAEACNKKMKMVIMKVIVLVRVIVMRLFRHPPPPTPPPPIFPSTLKNNDQADMQFFHQT